MRRLRWLALVAVAVAFAPASLIAQELGTVTGQVVSQATQQPIAGATVLVGGSQLRAVTDAQGRFRIERVPAGARNVSANQLGFGVQTRRVTVPAGGVATVDFSLSPATAVELEGIVVNAVTGEEERVRELGNAVGRIDVANVELAPVTTAQELLQGRVAGVNIQTVNGTTGTGQRIRIRGANSLSLANEPLVIVDGIRFDAGSNGTALADQDASMLNSLNPTDIKSIEVLKGPAASGVYGTAAANGVIVITTKKGTTGDTRYNFYVEGGTVNDETDYPSTFAALRPVAERGRSVRAQTCLLAFSALGFCNISEVVSFDPLNNPATSPFDQGERYKFGGSVSGGNEAVTFYLSGDREREDGVYLPNDVERTTLRANVRALLSDQLTLTASTGWINSEFRQPSNDNSILSPIINGLLGPAIVEEPVTQESYNYPWFGPQNTNRIFDDQNINRFIGSFNANWQPIPWLSINSNAGVDIWDEFEHTFLQPGVAPIAPSWTIGWINEERGTNQTYTFNSAANATFALTPTLNSTTTAGVDYNHEVFRETEAFGAGISPLIPSLDAATQLFSVGEDNSEQKTIGGFFQQQLGWRDRVFVTGAARWDDNSSFGKDFGVIFYPSVSASWVVSEEDFFPQGDWVNSFRLRAAYGKSGLRPRFRDAQTFFSPQIAVLQREDLPGISVGGLGLAELEPEKVTEFEAGFDAGFLNDRLALELTYFNKTSEDALIRRELPPSLGLVTSIFENLGEVENQGLELALDGRIIDTDNFRWSTRLSASTLDNTINEIGEGIPPIIFNRGNQRHQTGFTAGAFFQPELTFEDADGDGILSPREISVADSATFIGPVLPEFNASLSTDLSFWNVVRVSTLFDSQAGNYQLNYNEQFRCLYAVIFRDRGCQGAWDPDAPLEAQAAFLGYIFGDPETGRRTSAGFIEEADFIRWRELAVTLTPPQKWFRRFVDVNNVSVTIAGRNLGTWTDYTGLDPQANETGSSSNFTQGEFNTQPPVRYWIVRMNFDF